MIKKYLKKLENININYIYINNNKINNEYQLTIIINPDNIQVFHEYMSSINYNQYPYKEGREAGYIFLYSMNAIEYWKNKNNNLNILVFYQLACHGLLLKSWIPLDKKINESIWINRKKDEKMDIFVMGNEDEFIYSIVNAIFNKKNFDDESKKQINNLKFCLNSNTCIEKLKLVFFKFTPILVKRINDNIYENLIEDYIKFSDY